MSGLRASYRFCSDLSRREARNFYYSFRLLPAGRRRSMCALYAFLRRTDDLADEAGTVEAKAESLREWRAGLDSAISGDLAGLPGWPAVADTVRGRGIPSRYLHEVIDGVEMDLALAPFEAFDDLAAYCHRVASAVGLACLHIWGYRPDGGRAEALAEACGVALQLTNIIRDVREDALNGRIYLPREDLRRYGVEPAELTADRPSPAVRDLLAFEADRARSYYDRAAPLVGLVDPLGRPVLLAIVGIYRALLDEIVRRDHDVFSGRVSLPTWRKLAITLRSLRGRFVRPTPELAEPGGCGR